MYVCETAVQIVISELKIHVAHRKRSCDCCAHGLGFEFDICQCNRVDQKGIQNWEIKFSSRNEAAQPKNLLYDPPYPPHDVTIILGRWESLCNSVKSRSSSHCAWPKSKHFYEYLLKPPLWVYQRITKYCIYKPIGIRRLDFTLLKIKIISLQYCSVQYAKWIC